MDTSTPGFVIADEHKQRLELIVSEWQIAADLAFCDVVLWYPHEGTFIAHAQARPVTAQTTLPQDMTGSRPPAGLAPVLEHVLANHEPVVASEDFLHAPPGVSAWPVVWQHETIAVVTVHQNLVSKRRASRLEEVYRQSANDLFVMIANGLWPAEDSKASSTSHGNPRVGDGLVHIDAHGLVTYASPNATSAFRKLGIRESMEGRQLSRMVTNHLDQGTPVNESMPAVLFGRQSARVDIETRKIVLSARSIPLINQDGELFAALVLLRDITEIRRRDEQLISKDATIREIHHRVKNNLQTVGSLLRMQSRRMQSDDARQALLQAMSRVDAIAMVHETLSQTMDATVDMDELLHRQFTMAVDIAAGSKAVTTVIRGSFGELPGHLATPLALVVNELATNAVEHGTAAHGGEITLLVKRLQGTDNRDSQLKVEVVDEGKSGSADATYSIGNGLGTQIIRTLVESDLRGTICWQRQHPATTGTAGTRAIVHIPLEL
ncbi:MAG TPA: PAS domain-containing sensor histidine kinase [Candidatus Yaniella excrementigallinarum]|nr:PAS domain-containing sensor histidine kinase [Candidatus Yaniella excrementigallinarum]